jgi:hypothetical protein
MGPRSAAAGHIGCTRLLAVAFYFSAALALSSTHIRRINGLMTPGAMSSFDASGCNNAIFKVGSGTNSALNAQTAEHLNHHARGRALPPPNAARCAQRTRQRLRHVSAHGRHVHGGWTTRCAWLASLRHRLTKHPNHCFCFVQAQWVRFDLLEERAVYSVRMVAGPVPAADDATQIWVGNNASLPVGLGNGACELPPPFEGAGSTRVFNCAGLFGRYVFSLVTCTAPGCFSNYAGACAAGREAWDDTATRQAATDSMMLPTPALVQAPSNRQEHSSHLELPAIIRTLLSRSYAIWSACLLCDVSLCVCH